NNINDDLTIENNSLKEKLQKLQPQLTDALDKQPPQPTVVVASNDPHPSQPAMVTPTFT
ncbi:hypothetical protein RF55_25251, partial [Lasius niger]